jgi:pimeloyl-ACP methyl ester carboxylesterase
VFVAAVAILAAAAAYLLYSRELSAARKQVSDGATLADTPIGVVEFAEAGDGPQVLVLHGAGGGYDQGLLIGEAFVGKGHRRIAPSRFGYLRSVAPANPSTAAQSDALAYLLDHLGIERVAVVAMSGGVPPALQLASRYPDQVSALVLISSAPFTPLGAGDQKLPIPAWLYQALFSSDFPYWLLQKVAPSTLDAVFDVKAGTRDSLAEDEAMMLANIIAAFQPVTNRVGGLRNEGAAIDPAIRYELDRIYAPTLVIHARDDGINPFAISEFIAAGLRSAEFMAVEEGGHLLLGHQSAVRDRVNEFLKAHDVR